jgi:predicted DNA-binding protein
MPETKNLLLRLDPALAEQLQAVASVEGRPVSEVVREAIQSLVEARRRDRGFQKRLRQSAAQYQRLLDRLQDGT